MCFHDCITEHELTFLGPAKSKSKSKRKNDYFYSPVKSEKVGKTQRVPCKICQACIRADCATCLHCRDMIRYEKSLKTAISKLIYDDFISLHRFGGPGHIRQPCELRKCIQPLLPLTVVCNICGLDGWYAEPSMRLVE